MKNTPKRPATPDVQPKTRRRARAAPKRQKARAAGHLAGADFFIALISDERGSAVCKSLKIDDRSGRAEIRKIVARGDIIGAPFAGEDEKRLEFTCTKRERRVRAILAQHARRFGLPEIGAKKFNRRVGR